MANQIPQPDAALHTASHLMQYHDLIESIVAAMDARDAYTAKHSYRVADMVLVLATALDLSEDETTLLLFLQRDQCLQRLVVRRLVLPLVRVASLHRCLPDATRPTNQRAVLRDRVSQGAVVELRRRGLRRLRLLHRRPGFTPCLCRVDGVRRHSLLA